MAEPQGTVWIVQPCTDSWVMMGESVTMTTFWSGATHKTVARDVARNSVDDITQCWAVDDLDGEEFRFLVTSDTGVTKRIKVKSSVEVSFRVSEIDGEG